MLVTEVLLVMLPKRVISDLLVQYDIRCLGTQMQESGYLVMLEGEPNNLSDMIVEIVNMEFFLSEALEGRVS